MNTDQETSFSWTYSEFDCGPLLWTWIYFYLFTHSHGQFTVLNYEIA